MLEAAGNKKDYVYFENEWERENGILRKGKKA